jgi:HlyD family secretion protein
MFMNSIYQYITKTLKSLFAKAKQNRIIAVVAGIFVVLAITALTGVFSKEAAVVEEVKSTTVKVASVRDLGSSKLFSAVGTVEAVSEARLQTESGGRVVAVYAKIGDTVPAGAILVSLENASERAFLLQAEGAYEAAQAAAAQSNIGTKEAEIRLESALLDLERVSISTYGTVQDVLINKIDTFYANPNESFPSLRLSTLSNTKFLSDERLALQTTLATWSKYSFAGKSNEANYAHVEFIKEQLTRLINIVDILRTAVNDDSNDTRYTDAERESLNADLTAARAALVGAQNSVDVSKSGLMNAVEGIERAQISSTGGVASASSAQLKQALGAYRSAQANFEKTIVRTPISGVVNALYLKAGDYVSPSTPAAIVANNNGLEISTSVSEEEANNIAVGDTVYLDKTATGTVTAIGGAIDPTTGKVAIKISVADNSSVSNGSTVSISFAAKLADADTEIRIPLSAIKMTGSGPVVFTVNDKQELAAISVVLGPVSGNDVVINSGVTPDSEIVVDARGLKAGQVVTISTN